MLIDPTLLNDPPALASFLIQEYDYQTVDQSVYYSPHHRIGVFLSKDHLLSHEGQTWGVLVEEKGFRYFFIDSKNTIDLGFVAKSTDRFSHGWRSLVHLLVPPTTINMTNLAEVFGKHSIYYRFFTTVVEGIWDDSPKLRHAFEEWYPFFEETYQDLSAAKMIYFSHSYLCLVVLSLCELYLTQQTSEPQVLDQNDYDRLQRILGLEYFGVVHLDSFSPFREFVRAHFSSSSFDEYDLFASLYQQLISTSDRHNLGEFYTPQLLVEAMVEQSYKPGMTVLDPSCGSGTFLVEVVTKLKTWASDDAELWTEFERIYGFDLNPAAVFVCRANLLLQLPVTRWTQYPFTILHLNTIIPSETTNRKTKVNREKTGGRAFESLDPPKRSITIRKLRDKRHELFRCCCPQITPWIEEEVFGHQLFRNIFDLVIGNPPWLVLNGINSENYKDLVKQQADSWGIKPTAKNITNFELSALFVAVSTAHYLREGGELFFVVSNAFLSGAQHDYTRQFKNLRDIVMWRFTTDIFRIHNICLRGTKGHRDHSTLETTVKTFDLRAPSPSNPHKPTLVLVSEERYVPYAVEVESGRSLFKRLVPASELDSLLPRGPNIYSPKCFQGAVVIPRTFFFVHVIREDETTTKIRPDKTGQTKPPWDFLPYEEAVVETDNVFKLAKSTELVPFLLLGLHRVFLPINKNDYSFLGPNLKPHANKHYQMLEATYQRVQKSGAALKTLWSQINYQQKLATPRQKAPIKVLYNQSGSMVKAAVFQDPSVIIDSTLYLIPVESEAEAYYLCSVLNAPCITHDLKFRAATGAHGSIRHVHKIPMSVAIPAFAQENSLHTEIAHLGRVIEGEVTSLVHSILEQGARKEKVNKTLDHFDHISPLVKPRTIQNRVLRSFSERFLMLDKLVQKLFSER